MHFLHAKSQSASRSILGHISHIFHSCTHVSNNPKEHLDEISEINFLLCVLLPALGLFQTLVLVYPHLFFLVFYGVAFCYVIEKFLFPAPFVFYFWPLCSIYIPFCHVK